MLVTRLGEFILPGDAEVARASGALEANAVAEGAYLGASDAIVAGTAAFSAFAVGVMGWNDGARAALNPFEQPIERLSVARRD